MVVTFQARLRENLFYPITVVQNLCHRKSRRWSEIVDSLFHIRWHIYQGELPSRARFCRCSIYVWINTHKILVLLQHRIYLKIPTWYWALGCTHVEDCGRSTYALEAMSVTWYAKSYPQTNVVPSTHLICTVLPQQCCLEIQNDKTEWKENEGPSRNVASPPGVAQIRPHDRSSRFDPSTVSRE